MPVWPLPVLGVVFSFVVAGGVPCLPWLCVPCFAALRCAVVVVAFCALGSAGALLGAASATFGGGIEATTDDACLVA